MKYISFLIIFLFILVITTGNATSARTSSIKTITIGTNKSLITSLISLAKEKKYFQEEGIDIKLKSYPSCKRALNGFVNNETSLVITAETPFIVETFKTPNIRLFATLGSSDNDIRIIGRSDHNIREPKDLIHKRIGVQKGCSTHFFLNSFLLFHNINSSDIKEIFLKREELIPALKRGEIDAISIREPYLKEANKSLGKNFISFSQAGLYTKSSNLIGLSNFRSDNPNVIEKILNALIKAEDYANSHAKYDTTIRLSIDHSKGELDSMQLGVSLNQLLLRVLEEQIIWAKDENLITNVPKNYNVLDFIDLHPLLNIKPEVITIFAQKD